MKLLHSCLALSLLLSACHPDADPVAKEEPRGREETRTIRNTEAVGYSGNAVADKVDSALDTNDQRKEQLDREMDAQQQ